MLCTSTRTASATVFTKKRLRTHIRSLPFSPVYPLYTFRLRSTTTPPAKPQRNIRLPVLFNTLARINKVSEATHTFNAMLQKGWKPDLRIYTTLIALYGRNGQRAEALRTFTQMKAKKIKPDVTCYNLLLDMYASIGDTAVVAQVVGWMSSDGLEADCFTFSGIMKNYIRRKDGLKAVRVLETAVELGVQPDNVMFNMLVQAHFLEGNVEAAEQVFRMMDESGIADAYTCGIVTQGLVTRGDLEKALQFHMSMSKRGIRSNAVTFTTMMNGYAKRGQVNQVYQCLELMKAEGVRPVVAVYNVLIWVALNIQCSVQLSKDLVREMMDYPLSPNVRTISIFVHGLLRLGSVEEAAEVLRSCEIPLNAVAYTTFINALLGSGPQAFDDANRFFRDMTEEKAELPKPDVVTYTIMMNAHSRSPDALTAIQGLFQEMIERGIVPDAVVYNSLLAAHARLGTQESTIQIFAEMLEADVRPSIATFATLLRVLIKSANIDPRSSLSLTPQLSGLLRTSSAHARTVVLSFVTLVLAFTRRKDVVTLRRLITELRDHGIRMNDLAYSQLLSACTGDSMALVAVVRVMLECQAEVGNRSGSLLRANGISIVEEEGQWIVMNEYGEWEVSKGSEYKDGYNDVPRDGG